MNLSTYGHRLVRLYNQQNGTAHDARAFFDRVFFPIVYDDVTPLQSISNSPFFVLFEKSPWKTNPSPEKRREALRLLHEKADSELPDGSFVLGYPAARTDAVTSGQVGHLSLPVSSDDVFASWIGGALALTVGGGFSLLIDDDVILWRTFEGWKEYRALLRSLSTADLKPRQINTWNSWWLVHRLSEDYLPGALPQYELARAAKPSEPPGISTLEWTQLVLALAWVYPDRTLPTYVFNLGNTNTTVGFLPLRLPEVARLYDVLDHYFSNVAGLTHEKLGRLYRTDQAFRLACERGAIGLQAMPPAGLRDYYPAAQSRTPDSRLDAVQAILYQTWILAMLGPDHEDLYLLARQTAAVLVQYTREARGLSREGRVNELLSQNGKRGFMQKLTELVEDEPTKFLELDRLAARVYAMPLEPLRLFLTLVKFQYAGLRHQQSTELN